MSESIRIIGIGGRVRSGKDEMAEAFVRIGYFGVSSGDIVRGYARKRHATDPSPISIANMTETANWLRAQKGADFLIKEALKNYKQQTEKYKGLVVYSIRAPIEVDYILENKGHLIWVEADDMVRFERAGNSLRPGDQKLTFEQFKQQEDLQLRPQPGIPKEVQMDLEYVKSHATQIVENNGNNLDEYLALCNSVVSNIDLAKELSNS